MAKLRGGGADLEKGFADRRSYHELGLLLVAEAVEEGFTMFGEVVPHGEHALDRPICPKGGVGCWVLWAAGGRARAVEEESGGGTWV